MRSQLVTNIATYGCLGLAAAVSFLLPNSLPGAHGQAATPPDTIRLTGKVLDFRQAHSDFDVIPASGYGHYAGNVALSLDGDGRPAFTGGGYQVRSQWIERHNEPFAPHLYRDPNVLLLANGPTLDSGAFRDTWDSSAGPYGPGNLGPAPGVQTGSPMPTLSEPGGMGPSAGDYTPGSFSIVNINSNQHWDTFEPGRDSVINIMSNATILCENDFILNQRIVLNILPGASLKLYVKGLFRVSRDSMVNMNTFDPNRCTIYNLGTTQMEINQRSHVCATIYTPKAPLHLAQDDHFYGKFIGLTVDQDQNTGFHLDTSPFLDGCSNLLADTPGVAGAASTAAVKDATTFDEWYQDILGTNLSARHTITLTRNNSGIYEFVEPAFHPIDGMLFGNEGMAHNFYFTYAISTSFVYDSCSNQFFEFEGCDDAWAYVDGSLVMDLGGVMPGTSQYVDMDRLGLVDGQSYEFTFFYAQRQASCASFSMRTNIEFIVDTPTFTVSATAD